MSRIHLLEDGLINKIAAGEVVERPASVVKELVENSIDAEASEIRVELRDGGKEFIAVTDNGGGMAREDVDKAVMRHATSKILDADDLFAVDTLGFRGEALASIASVSHFSILTREKGAPSGTKLDFVDERAVVGEWQGSSGTTVTVKDLFYNIPVRKGFLKKTSSEYGAILEYIQAMALNIPSVGFTLVHNGRETLRVRPLKAENHEYFRGEQPLRQRAIDVFGAQEIESLLYCTKNDKHGHVEALISSPGHDRGTGKYVFTFVNGRWVKDKTLRYGVMRGFHSHLLKGRHPFAILHLSIDPSLVDVNVHPSKTELRFQYSSEVQNLIAMMIREGLRSGAWASEGLSAFKTSRTEKVESKKEEPVILPRDFDLCLPKKTMSSAPKLPISSPAPSLVPKTARSSSQATQGVEKPSPQKKHDPSELHWQPAVFKAAPSIKTAIVQQQTPSSGEASSVEKSLVKGDAPPDPKSVKGYRGDEISWSSLNYIGSYANCYLMFDLGPKLLVVDQHAFHERILYERFKKDYRSMGDSQRLLMPEVVDISQESFSSLEEKKKILAEVGFELVFLDQNVLELHAVPILLKDCRFEELLTELSVSLHHQEGELSESGMSHQILSTMACHAAVRAGEKLGYEDVGNLIKEADGIDFFLNCPHGRRVFRTFKRKEVEGWFDR